MSTHSTLGTRFDHIPPFSATEINMHARLRKAFKDVAAVAAELPPSRETTLAMTKLEEALFWANASVARNVSRPKHLTYNNTHEYETKEEDDNPTP